MLASSWRVSPASRVSATEARPTEAPDPEGAPTPDSAPSPGSRDIQRLRTGGVTPMARTTCMPSHSRQRRRGDLPSRRVAATHAVEKCLPLASAEGNRSPIVTAGSAPLSPVDSAGAGAGAAGGSTTAWTDDSSTRVTSLRASSVGTSSWEDSAAGSWTSAGGSEVPSREGSTSVSAAAPGAVSTAGLDPGNGLNGES